LRFWEERAKDDTIGDGNEHSGQASPCQILRFPGFSLSIFNFTISNLGRSSSYNSAINNQIEFHSLISDCREATGAYPQRFWRFSLSLSHAHTHTHNIFAINNRIAALNGVGSRYNIMLWLDRTVI